MTSEWIDIPNSEALIKRFRDKGDKLKRNMRAALRKIGDRIAADAARRAARDTGKLAGGIRARMTNVSTTGTAVVVSPDKKTGWHGAFFEYPQRSATATVRWRTVNGIEIKREHPFERRVNLHYRPFMQPAFRATRESVLKDSVEAINEAVQK